MKNTISVLSLIATLLLSSYANDTQENVAENISREKSDTNLQSRQSNNKQSIKEIQ
ncbi:hypothetical protein AB670_03164 [Chryseobacterium sp. MOF25P]|jgi:hypothetical protein|uniref:hypothetical protein n=1 Tax=unclassified Chryseobacterium TaxID=2593645 RepID=UPI0008052579|nr:MULTISPECIES: hypothetical protein [unclassified Chryseobacterium]OBW40500.1 hypothetical protein AB670_03164 [Chryseobacterium sp. MOF25P]OBW46756.1 hypothetical protein AB671_01107 [Chryseobacterium sp. BGARF1]